MRRINEIKKWENREWESGANDEVESTDDPEGSDEHLSPSDTKSQCLRAIKVY